MKVIFLPKYRQDSIKFNDLVESEEVQRGWQWNHADQAWAFFTDKKEEVDRIELEARRLADKNRIRGRFAHSYNEHELQWEGGVAYQR